MPNKDQGQLSQLWLPGDPADAIVKSPSVIVSAGSLRNRIEAGYNHPCAIPGCYALYDFTDENIVTLYDKSGNGRDLTCNGTWTTAQFIDTIFGKAYAFNDEDDATLAAQTISGPFTVEVIMRINTDTASNQWVTDLNDTSYPCSLLQQRNGLTGDLRFRCYGTEFGSGFLAVDHIGEIVHLAGVYDDVTGKIYINTEQLNETTITTRTATGTFVVGDLAANGSESEQDIMAIRWTNRALDPSEFMHHWYLKTLVDGNLGGSSVLFDPTHSAFPKNKSHLVTVNWKKEEKQEWANLVVNNKKGSPTNIILPAVDSSDLYIGSLPEVDEYTIGYWLLDGTLSSDSGGNTGLVKDLSGNDYHGTLVSLDETDLINTKYGQAYNILNSGDYIDLSLIADQLSTLTSITIEWLFIWTANSLQLPFSMANNAGDEYLSFPIGNFTGTWADESIAVELKDAAVSKIFAAYQGGHTLYQDGLPHTMAFTLGPSGGNRLFVDGQELSLNGTGAGSYGTMINDIDWVRIEVYYNETGYPGFIMPYLRISSIERTQDEIVHNALNFHRRANGVIQDSWLT